jgi:hypothetical protein
MQLNRNNNDSGEHNVSRHNVANKFKAMGRSIISFIITIDSECNK